MHFIKQLVIIIITMLAVVTKSEDFSS